jgi:hypothetical protein
MTGFLWALPQMTVFLLSLSKVMLFFGDFYHLCIDGAGVPAGRHDGPRTVAHRTSLELFS